MPAASPRLGTADPPSRFSPSEYPRRAPRRRRDPAPRNIRAAPAASFAELSKRRYLPTDDVEQRRRITTAFDAYPTARTHSSEKEPAVSTEYPRPRPRRRRDPPPRRYKRACEARLWPKFGAVEHWAKVEAATPEAAAIARDRLRARFGGALDAFAAARALFDPKQILGNDLLDAVLPPAGPPRD